MDIIGMVLILITFIGFLIFVKDMTATLNNLILGKSVKEPLKIAIIGVSILIIIFILLIIDARHFNIYMNG
ncbi:hypothetical protein [Anaerosalibacter massiliensis]|uniref:hypothetical protein n=1 Tax=Anaerosalibacter massiliensis TaxID=1347392 RepID=UPI0005B2C4E8|nr:hypothetical protein [Anaerosalibacter massiliensis]